MNRSGILSLGAILMSVCLVSSGLLFFVHWATKGRIKEQEAENRESSLRIVLPQAVSFSPLTAGELIDYYVGYDRAGRVAGYAVSGSSPGYSSTIVVMAGVDVGGVLTGIKILEQKETPGLGDEAVRVHSNLTLWDVLLGRSAGKSPPRRPPFQVQFVGKTLAQLAVVKKPDPQKIQAITGATITSRAVTVAVRQSLDKLLRQGTCSVGEGPE